MKETATLQIHREVDGHVLIASKMFYRSEIESFWGGEASFLRLVYLDLQRQLDESQKAKQP